MQPNAGRSTPRGKQNSQQENGRSPPVAAVQTRQQALSPLVQSIVPGRGALALLGPPVLNVRPPRGREAIIKNVFFKHKDKLFRCDQVVVEMFGRMLKYATPCKEFLANPMMLCFLPSLGGPSRGCLSTAGHGGPVYRQPHVGRCAVGAPCTTAGKSDPVAGLSP